MSVFAKTSIGNSLLRIHNFLSPLLLSFLVDHYFRCTSSVDNTLAIILTTVELILWGFHLLFSCRLMRSKGFLFNKYYQVIRAFCFLVSCILASWNVIPDPYKSMALVLFMAIASTSEVYTKLTRFEFANMHTEYACLVISLIKMLAFWMVLIELLTFETISFLIPAIGAVSAVGVLHLLETIEPVFLQKYKLIGDHYSFTFEERNLQALDVAILLATTIKEIPDFELSQGSAFINEYSAMIS